MQIPEQFSRWQHRKRGTFYVIEAIASGQGDGIEGKQVVVYRGDGTANLYARSLIEFMDGRFAPAPNTDHKLDQ